MPPQTFAGLRIPKLHGDRKLIGRAPQGASCDVSHPQRPADVTDTHRGRSIPKPDARAITNSSAQARKRDDDVFDEPLGKILMRSSRSEILGKGEDGDGR